MAADIDFSKLLFRASANGDIMSKGAEITETQTAKIQELVGKAKVKPLTDIQQKDLSDLCHKRDNPQLGATCKKRLIMMYAASRNRMEDIGSKYMEKGTAVEEDSITWFSVLKGKLFRKNDIRHNNRYLTGEPDSFDGPDDDIDNAEEIIDFKSCWSYVTFLVNKMEKAMDKDYEWQGHSYMALFPSAKRFRLVYMLVNSPAQIIEDEKRKMAWTMRMISPESQDPAYVAACQQIERNHIFDIQLFRDQNPGFIFHNDEWPMEWDIPLADRIHELILMRSKSAINSLYRKIDWCRNWMVENF